MKYLVLVNPSSNGGRARETWHSYAAMLHDYQVYLLENIRQAQTLAAEASGYDAVVACGGDGTVNAVADGVLRNPDPNLKFGVLYAGTSPDFCRFHGIPFSGVEAVEVLTRGFVRDIPVLCANGHAFFCSCNLGIGAAVAHDANAWRSFLGDGLGTFCAAVRNILRARCLDFTLNGEPLPECSHLLITRMPYIAGGLRLALPELRDGEYAVWSLRNVRVTEWPGILRKLYRGESCGEFRIFHEAIRITGEGHIEFDGDPHGKLPLEISFSARKLHLITREN